MSPYLTTKGKWLFATGIIFILMGALVREPLLILFGQVPFILLTLALGAMMGAARSVERRATRLVVDGPGGVLTLRRDRAERLPIWMENRSQARLRVTALIPFTAGELEAQALSDPFHVEGHRGRRFELDIEPGAVGRASLQGFDVVLSDRWGLLSIRDYLPCVQVFETYPAMTLAEQRRASLQQPTVARAARAVDRRSRAGTDLRELRDFQPGDPLRMVAWKATIRQRRLITREFDDERSHVEYLALDISSSMRAGSPRGLKFDHAIDVVAQLTASYLDEGLDVGLWTFDENVYGKIEAARGKRQRKRMQWHLVGLNTVVEPRYTVQDDHEIEEALADYLLVQEKLDFRHGHGPNHEVNRPLLRRWLRASIGEEHDRWRSPGEYHGVVADPVGPLRRFFQLRGIPLAPRSEVRPGAKVSGIEAVLQDLLRSRSRGGRLTIVSDLCGLNEVEVFERLLRVCRRRGIAIRFLAPFTPHYGADGQSEDLLRDLFTHAERSDRLKVARRLMAMGVPVRFIGPEFSPEKAR